ncbi:MAG: GNAT family N-acetyltransferase [Bacteroidota bacterium]
MEIKYIYATEADIQTLVDQRVIFSDELVGKQDALKELEFRKLSHDYFKEELNKNYLCWYAEIDGKVAAIAGLVIRRNPGNMKNPSGYWGYLMNVYTAPEHRKKGLSLAILDKLIASGRERGITAFELHATKDGEPVYIKNGFQLHNEPTYRKHF